MPRPVRFQRLNPARWFEEPFPWLLIVVWLAVAAPIIGLVFAVTLGVLYARP